MRYGYFDDEAREYVITDPQTPVKWINYTGRWLRRLCGSYRWRGVVQGRSGAQPHHQMG